MLSVLFLVTWLSVGVLPVWAVPFTATPPNTLGPLNGGSVLKTVISPGASSSLGNATLTFDLVGYLSVDGANCCTDTFSLRINGNLLFQGGFDMDGGGSTFVNFIAPGVSFVPFSNGFFAGGLTKFSVAHTLVAGANNYLFDYGVMQGPLDEGWGLRNLGVTADVTASPVPEPSTLGLLSIGLLGLGLSAYRRQFVKANIGNSELPSSLPA